MKIIYKHTNTNSDLHTISFTIMRPKIIGTNTTQFEEMQSQAKIQHNYQTRELKVTI